MGHIKRIFKVGRATGTTGGTLAFSSVIDEGPVLRECFMDILCNVVTLAGTSPTLTYSVEELFSDTYFTTAISTAVAATGQTHLTYDPGSPIGAANGAHPLLGKGMQKRIVFTQGGTPTELEADFYAVFYSDF